MEISLDRKPCRARSRLVPRLLLVLPALLLTACEAPLRLEAVDQRLDEAVRRTDQFQAAASNDNAIVVVGTQGTVLTSTDQGASWNRDRIPGWPPLIDVTACADGSFAALAPNGLVLLSKDDGVTWESRKIDTEEAVQDISCGPGNRLWVVGSFSSFFSSADGGENWKLDSTEEDLIFTNIQFVTEDIGYASGEFGTVMRSNDGGESWEPLPILENDFYPQHMYFRDESTGWLAGLGGVILHTTDGGQSWTSQKTQTPAAIYSIQRVGEDMFAVGGEGTVLKLVGEEWLRIRHGKPIRLFLRATLAVGDDRLLIGGRQGALYVLPTSDLPIGGKRILGEAD